MVEEAEKYKSEDEANKQRVEAKNGLENYAYNVKSTMNDEKLKDKIEEGDKTTVLEAVKQDGAALQLTATELRKDRTITIVLEAVRSNGMVLEHAPQDMRASREILLQAMKQNWEALQYASEELRMDREVMFAAAVLNVQALQ